MMQLLRVLFLSVFCAAVRANSDLNVELPLDSTVQRLMSTRVRRSAELSKSVPEEEKRYAVLVDAGSSGSRVFMYWWRQAPTASWQQPAHTRLEFVTTSSGEMATFNIDKSRGGGISEAYERAAREGREGQHKAEHPTRVALESYLSPLLNYTAQFIPASKRATTPIFIYATVCSSIFSYLSVPTFSVQMEVVHVYAAHSVL